MAVHKQYLFGSRRPVKGVRVFGVPGASLNSAGFNAGAVAAGIQGEEAVAAVLDKFARTVQGFYAFHSVKLPGKIADIDHMVVYGRNILVIDAKNWAAGKNYHLNSAGLTVTRDGRSFHGGDIQLFKYIAQMKGRFHDYTVGGILCVAKNNVIVSSDSSWFNFATLEGLERLLENFVEDKGVQLDVPVKILAKFTSLVMNPMSGRKAVRSDVKELNFIREGSGAPKLVMVYPKFSMWWLLPVGVYIVSLWLALAGDVGWAKVGVVVAPVLAWVLWAKMRKGWLLGVTLLVTFVGVGVGVDMLAAIGT